MRICFLASASSIHTVRWVNALANLGHEVHLITVQKSKLDKIDQRVSVYELKIQNKLGYYLNVFEARNIIKKLKPEVLNVHYASGYGTLGRLVNFDAPTLLSVWGSDVFLFPYQSKWNEKTLTKTLNAATRIASTSLAMKEQTLKFVSPSTPIDITPFGIDMTVFKPQKNLKQDHIVIGTVKGLQKVYGVDILIQAISKLKNTLITEGHVELADKLRVQIVGDGSELASLEELAKDLNLSEIIQFVGPVPNEKVPEYLNRFDIYCALSRSESFGVAVLEASACEVPVIVSEVGGLPEVVSDGKTGFIVDHNEIDEIVEALSKLVKNQNLRIEFGQQGRDFVAEKYDWNKNIASMIDVYKKTIENYQHNS